MYTLHSGNAAILEYLTILEYVNIHCKP